MGSFCYLINYEKKIRVEVYQHSASGNEINIPTNEKNVTFFLEYCRKWLLLIQCVHESYFEDRWEEGWIDFDAEVGKKLNKI